MKKILITGILTIAFSLSAFSLDQPTEAQKYSSAVGVQAIARSVVSKKLVDSDARRVILLALETGRAEFGEMTCDRATGKDICNFDVFIKDDESTSEAEETLYNLDVTIYQGIVVHAIWSLIAG